MSLPPDVAVLVRGWLHGNVVRLDGAVIDSGYGANLEVLLDWIPACEVLALTHVHSDHAGGASALVGRFGCRVLAHPDAAGLVERWDRGELWLEGTGQELAHFAVDAALEDSVQLGGKTWRVIETPGHAVGGVSFLREHDGVLVSGDALWEDGFGLLNPWSDPPGVFERTHRALSNLEQVEPAVVIPGHGQPFTDFRGALSRARSRLEHLEANPDRLRAQVIRNLVGFWSLANPGAGASETERMRERAEQSFAALASYR